MKWDIDFMKNIFSVFFNSNVPQYIFIILCVFTLFVIVREGIRFVHRKSFVIDFNLKWKDVPGFFCIKIAIPQKSNYYVLKYPRWEYENRDRSCDRRYRDNEIIWNSSILYLDQYIVSCTRPYNMVMLVDKIRKKNTDLQIEMCREEKRKSVWIYQRKRKIQQCSSIQGIIDSFSDDPFEFEEFVAGLYQKNGYTAICTPKTNDGGYDIELEKNAERAIVECKCYAQHIRIGRPAIQKLVGANQTEKAERMIFVTTSDYSQEAKDFAINAGVELINGEGVLRLIEAYYPDRYQKIEISRKEARLTRQEVLRYYPPDI